MIEASDILSNSIAENGIGSKRTARLKMLFKEDQHRPFRGFVPCNASVLTRYTMNKRTMRKTMFNERQSEYDLFPTSPTMLIKLDDCFKNVMDQFLKQRQSRIFLR